MDSLTSTTQQPLNGAEPSDEQPRSATHKWVPILDLLGTETRLEVPIELTRETFDEMTRNLDATIVHQLLRKYNKVSPDLRRLDKRWLRS